MDQIKQEKLNYHLMLEASPSPLVLVDSQGSIAYVNRSTEKLFQYTENELIGKTLGTLLPPRLKKLHAHLIQDFFDNPVSRQMGESRELSGVKKDGTEFPVEIGLNTLTSDSRTFVLAAIIDISERKKRDQQFRLIVESVPNAIILVDSFGKISMINKRTEKLFGYTKGELLGLRPEQLIPERFNHGHHTLREKFFESPEFRQMGIGRDLFAIKKNGSEFPVEIGLNPIETQTGIQILVSIIDITHRKLFEEERKKRDQQFRLIVESVPNAIILVSSLGKISMINKRTKKLFGYTKGELLGLKPERLIPERYNHDHHKLREEFFENPKFRQMGTGRDLFAIKKDGSEFPVEIGLNPIETQNGIQILVSIIDITHRKLFEEERKKYTRDIEVKNQELERTEKKLRDLNTTKDKLFSIIGHDLRGPIGTSKSLIDLILSDFDLTDTDYLTQTLETLQSTSSSTYDLLEILLEWAKSQQDEIVFSPKTMQPKGLVDTTINLLIEAANKKSIQIHNRIPEDQLVYADENMLSTTIRNLISNAIKFTPENKNITIIISEDENFHTINIKDEGVGIKAENLHKLFKAKESFTTYGTANEKGSGLGLLLCKEFVKKHGGRIWAESEVGKGSEFIFTLPKQKV